MTEYFCEKPNISSMKSISSSMKQLPNPRKVYLENAFPTPPNPPRIFLESPKTKSQKDILFNTVTNGMIRHLKTPSSPLAQNTKGFFVTKPSPNVIQNLNFNDL